MKPKQRAIGLVLFSSLQRNLCTREPGLLREPFGENPYEASFLLAIQDQLSQATNDSAALVAGIFAVMIYDIIRLISSDVFGHLTTD